MVYGGDPQDNPYAAPQEEIAPAYEVGPGKFSGYGGFWIRFLATLIDGLLLGVVVGIPMGILQVVVLGGAPTPVPGQAPDLSYLARAQMFNLISIIINVSYYALMESSKYQATLGKMALGLKVVDTYGRPISVGRAYGRELAKILSGLICLIGYIMAAFSAKKQALHDLIGGTLVVKA
jgi:uncharacterized RDD family membrane protein YckC